MAEQRRAPVFPDYDQAVNFHEALRKRLGLEPSEINETRLRGSLERTRQMAQDQRADLIMLAAFLLFGLIKDEPFGSGSAQTGLALMLAFLARHGVDVWAPEEELAGVALAVADGQAYAGMVETWLRESIGPIGR